MINECRSGKDCADYYACQFPAMIQDWREKFASPWKGTGVDLAFLFVGLPAYVEDLPSTPYDGKVDASLPLLRLSQAVAASTLNDTYVANHSLSTHGLFNHSLSTHGLSGLLVLRTLLTHMMFYYVSHLLQTCFFFNQIRYMTSLVDHGYLAGHDGSIHPMDKTPVGKR